jgi:hypothetical protein
LLDITFPIELALRGLAAERRSKAVRGTMTVACECIVVIFARGHARSSIALGTGSEPANFPRVVEFFKIEKGIFQFFDSGTGQNARSQQSKFF